MSLVLRAAFTNHWYRTLVARKSGISYRTATASGFYVIASLGARALDFISLAVLARLLTPDDFGLIAIALVFMQTIEAVFDIPIGGLLVRARPLTRALLDTGFTLTLIRGLVVFGLLASAASPIARFYSDPRLFWLVIALACAPLARAVLSIRMVLYARRLDGRPDFWLSVGSKAVSLVAAITVAATTRSYWAIAIATVTPWIASAIGSYFFAPYLPRLRLREWHFFYDFVGGMTLTQLFSALLWQFDKLFLGRLVSSETLGRFYMAGNVANLPFQVIGGPIIRPFSAALAISHARNSLVAAFQKATRAVCLVMAPIIVSIALLSTPILTLLLGDGWNGAAQWLTLLALASLPGLPIQTLWPLCIALNRTGALALRTGTEFALYVPMVVVGYFLAGIPGVIGARLLSLVVSAGISMFLVRSLLNLRIREQLADLISPAIATLALALVLAFLTTAIPAPTGRIALVAYVSGLGTVGMITYALTAVALWNAAGRPDGVERVAGSILAGLGRRAKSIAPLRS